MSGLIVTALLARILEPGDFGLVALAGIATHLLSTVTELGLTSALVQRREVGTRDLSTGFWLAMMSSSLVAIGAWAAADAVGSIMRAPAIVPFLRVMVLTLPISALGQIPDVLLQRKLDFRALARIDWISGVLSGVVGVAAALAGAGVWALVLQFISAAVVSTALRLLRSPWTPSLVFDLTSARGMTTYGASLVAVGLVNYATVNVDNALVGARIGAVALGYYLLAYNLVMMPSTNVGGLVSRVMFPALSMLQADRGRFVQAYAAMLRVVAVATFPLVVGLGVTAPMAILTFYGPKWDLSATLLQILATVGLFQAINVSGVAYSAIGRPHILLAWAIVSLVVMTAGFMIGSAWGVTGVAWAYVIVCPVVCIPPHLIANRLIGLPQAEFFRVIAAPLVSAVIMGAIVLLVRAQMWLSAIPPALQLFVLTGIGAIAYAGVLIAIAFAAGAGKSPLTWITRQTVRVAHKAGQA